jgi:hypothetical protein
MTRERLFLFCSVLCCAWGTVVGCAGVGDIDRTQPDKVPKAIFKNEDGSPREFFYRQTVIDVPATSGVTFIGEQGETERVIFEVTERFLYAYRAYGWLQNLEGGAVPGGQGDGYARPGTGPAHGAPLAAFAITSHFDVQRQYNPATGEQTNVIVEDTLDRPWYEREYMRVDWSMNQVADFRFGSSTALQTPASRSIPEKDDNPKNVLERPVIRHDYLDVVTEFHVVPETIDLSAYGYGKLPRCYFYTDIHKDCLGGTIKVRSSFLPVDGILKYSGRLSDYVPSQYDDLRFQKFGFFRTERFAYDDRYGVVEGAQTRLANRWNLWRDAASCYDATADKPYASCDPRQLRTIVYHLNEDFPRGIPEMLRMAKSNEVEWNSLFRTAILEATGWDEEKLGDVRLFRLCVNNPVRKGDPEECGPENTRAQIGDLRYSMYYYVPNYQYSPPLGYGPSAADPLTGEIIAGNAFYYGSAGATIAARTLDIVKVMLGLLTEDDLSGGLPAREAVAQAKAGAFRRRLAATRGHDIAERARGMAERAGLPDKARRLKRLVESGQAFVDQRAARTEPFKASGLDRLALTDEIREVFGRELLSRVDSVDDLDATLAAGLFDDDALFRRARDRQHRVLMAPSRTCMLSADDVFDDGLQGLTETIMTKFFNRSTSPPTLRAGFVEQDVFNFVLAQTMGDTQLHEIGHTVGLRHNFAGSTDALNFGPTYWELRGAVMNGTGTRPKPEWEISTTTEVRNYEFAKEIGLRDEQDSSIMDYASTYGTSTKLGRYDLAAIQYAYGDVVEVFRSPDLTPERARLLRAGEVHYLQYPEVVSNAETYAERTAALYDRRSINFRKVKPLDQVVAGDAIEVPFSFCSDEYRDASATCAIWDQGADNYERTQYAVDHYRNYRLLNAFKRERLTFGIDVFSYLSRTYGTDLTYILNQYKNWVNDELIVRDGRPCQVMDEGRIIVEAPERITAPSCGLAGYLGTVEAINLLAGVIQSPDVGCYARLASGCYDASVDNGSPSRPPSNGPLRLIDDNPAACDVFEPEQPDPGDRTTPRRIALKVTDATPYAHVPDSTSCSGYEPPIVIDDASGDTINDAFLVRELGFDGVSVLPANTLYDRNKFGYYFYIKPTVIGSWWDKWLAVKAIGDSNTDFIGVDASSDTRSFLISLNTLFGDELNNLIGGAITDEIGAYGPILNEDGTVEPVPLLNVNDGGLIDRSSIGKPFINPDQQYTFRLLALFNAAYNGQTTDDFQFGESIHVRNAYSVTDVHVPDDVRNDPDRYTQVTDPVTGMVWFAVRSTRSGNDAFKSIGYDFIRSIKERYYVDGADGLGTVLRPGYDGVFEFEPRQELEILQIMATTSAVFGRAAVWSGDIDL